MACLPFGMILDVQLEKPKGCNLSTVKDLFDSSLQIRAEARAALPSSAVHAIIDQAISLTAKNDLPCWTVTSNGSFSLSSAWHMVRKLNPILFTAKSVWHKLLPRQISLFLWRLLQQRLPIDEALRLKGI